MMLIEVPDGDRVYLTENGWLLPHSSRVVPENEYANLQNALDKRWSIVDGRTHEEFISKLRAIIPPEDQ